MFIKKTKEKSLIKCFVFFVFGFSKLPHEFIKCFCYLVDVIFSLDKWVGAIWSENCETGNWVC